MPGGQPHPEARCPGCGGHRLFSHYLCAGCWFAVPREARAHLRLKDEMASARAFRLYRALKNGRRPDEITAALVEGGCP